MVPGLGNAVTVGKYGKKIGKLENAALANLIQETNLVKIGDGIIDPTNLGNGIHRIAPAKSGSTKPAWLQRLDEGNAFNKAQSPRYPHNEVYIEKPGGGYYRLDSYNPRTGEIVSRKFTQFGDIQESTGLSYLNELAKKYAPGSKIADVPSSASLAGQRLRGRMILEVPVQLGQIPQSVLDASNRLGIVIRDVNGRVY